MGRFQRMLFAMDLSETTFERRKFRGGGEVMKQRLEKVGSFFLAGYHAAHEDHRPGPLGDFLDGLDLEHRGFAYEGAAMALALADALTPWKRDRLDRFFAERGDGHVYMGAVGAGWAMARLPFGMRGLAQRLDPLLRWLAFDGYGFHDGYFRWPLSVVAQRVPGRLRGYQRRAYDQGVGRSLWFVEGGEIARIVATIGSFPSPRHGDLWAGIGLSSTYAGGVERVALETLWDAAGQHRPALAQGASFAAKTRERAGNPAAHTELACQVFCGLSANAAAALTDQAGENLPADGAEPAFEIWRRRIQQRFSSPVGTARETALCNRAES